MPCFVTEETPDVFFVVLFSWKASPWAFQPQCVEQGLVPQNEGSFGHPGSDPDSGCTWLSHKIQTVPLPAKNVY